MKILVWIKGSWCLAKSTGHIKLKEVKCVLREVKKTWFQNEIFKILSEMYENNFQSWAIFQRRHILSKSVHAWYKIRILTWTTLTEDLIFLKSFSRPRNCSEVVSTRAGKLWFGLVGSMPDISSKTRTKVVYKNISEVFMILTFLDNFS